MSQDELRRRHEHLENLADNTRGRVALLTALERYLRWMMIASIIILVGFLFALFVIVR